MKQEMLVLGTTDMSGHLYAWKWNNVNPQNYAQIPTQLNTTITP